MARGGTRFRKLGLISRTMARRFRIKRLSNRNFSAAPVARRRPVAPYCGRLRKRVRYVLEHVSRCLRGSLSPPRPRPSGFRHPRVPHARALIPEYTCHRCLSLTGKMRTRADAFRKRDRARFPHPVRPGYALSNISLEAVRKAS